MAVGHVLLCPPYLSTNNGCPVLVAYIIITINAYAKCVFIWCAHIASWYREAQRIAIINEKMLTTKCVTGYECIISLYLSLSHSSIRVLTKSVTRKNMIIFIIIIFINFRCLLSFIRLSVCQTHSRNHLHTSFLFSFWHFWCLCHYGLAWPASVGEYRCVVAVDFPRFVMARNGNNAIESSAVANQIKLFTPNFVLKNCVVGLNCWIVKLC